MGITVVKFREKLGCYKVESDWQSLSFTDKIFLSTGQPYWSKDIIFVVSDHEQIGMQAWLDGYHQVDAECK